MKKFNFCLRLLAAAAIAWLAFAAPSQAQFATPEAPVKALYAMYAGKDAKGFPREEASAKQFFEPGLAKLWLDAKEIDSDFFIQGQDFELGPVKVAPAAVKGDKASVKVEFTNLKKPVRLTYELVKNADGWRISDVKSGKTSFRAALKKNA